MKEYLKMSDVFKGELFIDSDCDDVIVDDLSLTVLESFSGSDAANFALHAINSHDELVAEVDRLRDELYQLMQFYGVKTMEDLVRAQELHIRRLQESKKQPTHNEVLAMSPIRRA